MILLNGKRVLLVAVTLHFALIVAISCRDTFAALAEGEALFPNEWNRAWQNSEERIASVLGRNLAKQNPIRQTVATYVNAAGIEAGYGFFAPNIPGTNELVFELSYADGRVDYERLTMHGPATEFRLASLLDLIARVKDETVRQGLIKYLAYAIWREHPDAVTIRALFGTINFPPTDDFVRGERESYRATHVYDFTFEVKPQS